jgi:hypothetical protein
VKAIYNTALVYSVPLITNILKEFTYLLENQLRITYKELKTIRMNTHHEVLLVEIKLVIFSA